MCGVAGTIDQDPSRSRLRVEALNRMQAHRGPDNSSLAQLGIFTLGNTRLAIQDLSPAANQPLYSRDRVVACVFNGEIYNYRELRSRYGLETDSGTDGAVVPGLWRLMGKRCLQLLEGMWVLAVVDSRDGTLTLARDPFGIKPLYIRRFGDGSVAFASELNALASIGPRPAVEQRALSDFLHWGSVDVSLSPLESTAVVPPNTWVELSSSGTDTHRGKVIDGCSPYTVVTDSDETDPAAALRRSVELHLRSDVPTSLLLSSGIDSSMIASAARQDGHDVHCFTVKVAGAGDESQLAAATARHYRHPHHSVGTELADRDVEKFFASMQRPSIDGLNTFLVCKAIHQQGFKVALSGLGGDEAVGGYRHMRYFRAIRVLNPLRRLRWGPTLAGLASPRLRTIVSEGAATSAASFEEACRRQLKPATAEELTGAPAPNCSSAEGQTLADLIEEEVRQYLQRTLLADADAYSMCWSVELRVPLLDIGFFRAASATVRPTGGKAALVRHVGDPYLGTLLRRPKLGFSLPMESLLRAGPLAGAAEEARGPRSPVWDYVDRQRWQQLGTDEPARPWVRSWMLTILHSWFEGHRQRRREAD